jgi:hypothetical protein
VRVQLTNLYPDWIQGDLFDTGTRRQLAICQAADALNARFGKGALRRASQLTRSSG